MSDLFIAECYDRHIDPVIRVFDTLDAAVAYAKRFVRDGARFPEKIREHKEPGALYCATFSGEEGDRVVVKRAILNDDD